MFIRINQLPSSTISVHSTLEASVVVVSFSVVVVLASLATSSSSTEELVEVTSDASDVVSSDSTS
jgi:hypothetical protein